MITRVLISVLAILWLFSSILALFLKRKSDQLQARVEKLGAELKEATERLAASKDDSRPKSLLKAIDLIAAAGLPGLILLAAMAVSGFSGGAAITVALASLGGPAGMLGGVGVLITLGVAIARFGIAELSAAVVQKLLNQKSKAKLLNDIDDLPGFVPSDFRAKARSMLDQQ